MKITQPDKRFTNWYDIQVLSLGKLMAIKRALQDTQNRSSLQEEILSELLYFFETLPQPKN